MQTSAHITDRLKVCWLGQTSAHITDRQTEGMQTSAHITDRQTEGMLVGTDIGQKTIVTSHKDICSSRSKLTVWRQSESGEFAFLVIRHGN